VNHADEGEGKNLQRKRGNEPREKSNVENCLAKRGPSGSGGKTLRRRKTTSIRPKRRKREANFKTQRGGRTRGNGTSRERSRSLRKASKAGRAESGGVEGHVRDADLIGHPEGKKDIAVL